LQKQNGQGFDFDGGGAAAAAVFRTLHTVYCEFYFSGVCVDHWEQKEDPGYQVGGAAKPRCTEDAKLHRVRTGRGGQLKLQAS
jgi:hypothetical protein